MKFLAVLSLVALTIPAVAAGPFFGFADRLVMACGATGVVNVSFSEEGRLASYRHTQQADKQAMQSCLFDAYKKIAATPLPADVPSSASHVTILKEGTIKLY